MRNIMLIKKNWQHFTIVELLVSTSVIMILISLLSPSLKQSIEHSHSVKCKQALSKISFATYFYAVDHDDFLPELIHEEMKWGNSHYYGKWYHYLFESITGKPHWGTNQKKRTPTGEYLNLEFAQGDFLDKPSALDRHIDWYNYEHLTYGMALGTTAYKQSTKAVYGAITMPIHQIRYPDQSFIFGDSASPKDFNTDIISINASKNIRGFNILKNSLHYRHNDNQANVIFPDGHSESVGYEMHNAIDKNFWKLWSL